MTTRGNPRPAVRFFASPVEPFPSPTTALPPSCPYFHFHHLPKNPYRQKSNFFCIFLPLFFFVRGAQRDLRVTLFLALPVIVFSGSKLVRFILVGLDTGILFARLLKFRPLFLA